jgi:hypothetical protein
MFRRALASCVALVVAWTAYAQPTRFHKVEELNADLQEQGCRQTLVPEDEQSTLLVSCDEDSVVGSKDLRKWFFAADLSDTWARDHREEMTEFFAEYIALHTLALYYQTKPEMNQLAVMARVIGRDDYGQPVDDIVFTYGFDRELFRKTNPDHVRTARFRKIVKNWNPHHELKIEDE